MGIVGDARQVAMILIAIISCPASAQEERNCDPKAGLVDGSYYIPRTAPWWKCEDENTHMTSPERGVTPEQQQRLEKLSLTLFASNVPDYGPNAPKTSRLDLISRFGVSRSIDGSGNLDNRTALRDVPHMSRTSPTARTSGSSAKRFTGSCCLSTRPARFLASGGTIHQDTES